VYQACKRTLCSDNIQTFSIGDWVEYLQKSVWLFIVIIINIIIIITVFFIVEFIFIFLCDYVNVEDVHAACNVRGIYVGCSG